ncbi:MAG: hypothetical protein CMI18_02795 [Opitutaceae bacterium]|nr:hypothetical protein [Opitutaceae bacterium]|tara:strand:+ start:383 stop:1198 length:816 start_codon:yes stop_codon:yes gene_type:complete
MPKLGEVYSKALITGAGSGLGKAFSEALIDNGIAVWGTSRNPETFEKEGILTGVELDLNKERDLPAWFEHWDDQAGGFDILINNAGYGSFADFADLPSQELENQIQILLQSPLLLAQTAVRRFRERKKGCVVNVSSVAGELWIPYFSIYNAAKAGLSVFSQSLMSENPDSSPWVVDFRPADYKTNFNRNTKIAPNQSTSVAAVWNRLVELLGKAPVPEKAAHDLLSAIGKFSHCTCYSGSFFQTKIAPLTSRLFPKSLKRAILRHYFRLPP